MSHTRHLAVAFTLAILAGACGHADEIITPPETLAGKLPGTWSETFHLAGFSTVITLAVADTTVSGTGSYTLEAGRPGTIVVTGMITGGTTVDLDLARSDGWVSHFRGTLTARDSLSGFMSGHSTNNTMAVADPAPDSFHRIP